MKKISMFIGVMSVMAIVSCKEKEETPAVPETTTNQTIEVTTEAPAAEKNPDGTSISVGTDGVDVSTKNGTNSTSVKVSGGEAKVQVKK
jgi:predicted phage gp36 major capsid-like protein